MLRIWREAKAPRGQKEAQLGKLATRLWGARMCGRERKRRTWVRWEEGGAIGTLGCGLRAVVCELMCYIYIYVCIAYSEGTLDWCFLLKSFPLGYS